MKAAVFHGAGQPLSIEEIPTPEPTPGEVRVRVAGCGVCHTDLHYVDHGTPTFKDPPVVLGHEVAGTIDTLGEGVTHLSLGDRVLLPAVLSCGSCRLCREGRENVCLNGVMLGNHIDGGYAEFLTVPAKDVFQLPDEIPLTEGCIIADALTTPYHAVVNRGRVTPGDTVVVIGCGGVGLNVVQFANALGARVIAVDLSEEKLEWALKLGAFATIDASSVERVDKEVRRISGGGADVAFEVVGASTTQEQALACLNPGGRLTLVGYSPQKMALNAGRVMFRELEITGSLGCRPVDYPRVIEMVRQGRIRLKELVTHRFPLEEISDALQTLRDGKAIRAVIMPNGEMDHA